MLNNDAHNPFAGINLDTTIPIVCDSCGEEVFQQAFLMRKQSAIMSTTGAEKPILIPTFRCMSCGHVNSEFKPVIRKREEE